MPPKPIRTAAVARAAGVSPNTIVRWARAGVIASINRPGREGGNEYPPAALTAARIVAELRKRAVPTPRRRAIARIVNTARAGVWYLVTDAAGRDFRVMEEPAEVIALLARSKRGLHVIEVPEP